MLNKLKQSLFKDKVDGEYVLAGGLEAQEQDHRDFLFKDLGGLFDRYTPKQKIKLISPRSIKNQKRTNTCVWQSYAAAREAQEGVTLSPKSMVRYAVKHGYIRGNGFSTLREGQKVGLEFGVAEESLLPSEVTHWHDYAYGGLSNKVSENAKLHRGKSYFSVRTRDEIFKALDDGLPIHTGMMWRSAYNMSGGLKAPWILPWGAGYAVGGHAVTLIGYDMTRGLFKFQNSFGSGYGDNGCFYIPIKTWLKANQQGYVTVDLDEVSLEDFVHTHEGEDVKTKDNPAIYRIIDGQACPFPNARTFYAYGGSFNPPSYKVVSGKLLALVELGMPLSVEDSPHWSELKDEWDDISWMQECQALDRIHNLIT